MIARRRWWWWLQGGDDDAPEEKNGDDDDCKEEKMPEEPIRDLQRALTQPRNIGATATRAFCNLWKGRTIWETIKIYANSLSVMQREDPRKSITWSPNIHYLTSSSGSRCGSKKVADWQSWEIRGATIGLINSTNLGIALTPHHVVRPPPRSPHSLPRTFLGTLVSAQLWQNTTLEHLFWFGTIPVQYFDYQSAKKWNSDNRPPQIAWPSPILSTPPPSNFELPIFSR